MRYFNCIVLVVAVILLCVRPGNSRLLTDQEKGLKKRGIALQVLQTHRPVPPSGSSGCSYIPGSGGSGCPIEEMHFARGGGAQPAAATYSPPLNLFGVDSTNQK
ncbi:unnamed protein product [Fraxinus pennsylvanica]|uniref:Uncharacterized protein n=1 Tax=Fraxinus pennsylvanica TaxID=56036 RepID=A0AAD2A1I5_9LAMI|nr:unnamed protein product [Fraxinus pennsylvanica]